MIRYLCLTLIIIFFLPLTGCIRHDESSGGTVFFRVTRDFGREEIFAKELEVAPGESALQALQRHVNVSTGYGGRFITSIEGIASSTKEKYREDWFFYANGITAAVGGADYYPLDGDIIWWDYHSWGDMYFTPGVTGAFPQPFVNGYRGQNPGTFILATDSSSGAAAKMQAFFLELGTDKVEIREYNEKDLLDPPGIIMVIALWSELDATPYWDGLQKNREKTGWFAELSRDGFSALDITGKQRETYRDNVSAILATGSGLGDPRPVWLLTALDAASLERTVRFLVEGRLQLGGTFGILFDGEKIINIPR